MPALHAQGVFPTLPLGVRHAICSLAQKSRLEAEKERIMAVQAGTSGRGRPSAVAGNRKILVGTASWSDPGFVADWYPPHLPASKRLPWYAEHFNLVEVNSTFYGVPSPKTGQDWCEQTPRDFVFDVKLHQLLSRHSTPLKLLPPGLRSRAREMKNRVQLTPELEEAVVQVVLQGIQPLYDAGKMGALLLQMSPSFRPREHDLGELDHLLDLLSGHSLAVELRHREWLTGEQREQTVAYFKKHRVALVAVDAPRSEHFTVLPAVDEVTDPELAYLRAHGRNERGYISGRTVAERFDYNYPHSELEEIADRAEHLAERTDETHVIFNNNKSYYAPHAASRFRKVIAGRVASR
jgi:uncharacterized protein YecE (DUF72 family)